MRMLQKRLQRDQRRAELTCGVGAAPRVRVEVQDAPRPGSENREPAAKVLTDQLMLDALKVGVLLPVLRVRVG